MFYQLLFVNNLMLYIRCTFFFIERVIKRSRGKQNQLHACSSSKINHWLLETSRRVHETQPKSIQNEYTRYRFKRRSKRFGKKLVVNSIFWYTWRKMAVSSNNLRIRNYIIMEQWTVNDNNRNARPCMNKTN